MNEHADIVDHQILQVVLKCACIFRVREVKARMALAGLLYKLTAYIESMKRLEEELGNSEVLLELVLQDSDLPV